GELRRRQPRVNDEETRLPAELRCSFRVISIARPFAASRRLRTEARGRLWTVARATGVFVGSGGAGPGVRGRCPGIVRAWAQLPPSRSEAVRTGCPRPWLRAWGPWPGWPATARRQWGWRAGVVRTAITAL